MHSAGFRKQGRPPSAGALENVVTHGPAILPVTVRVSTLDSPLDLAPIL